MIQATKQSAHDSAGTSIITLTDTNFQSEVASHQGFVLVDFWAEWCGPCHILAPQIEEVAEEWGGLKVGKLDVDEHRQTAAAYGIMSLPTMVVFKDGERVGQEVGVRSADDIKEWLTNLGFQA